MVSQRTKYDTYLNISPFFYIFNLVNHKDYYVNNLIFFNHYGGFGMHKCRSPPFLF